MLQFFIYIHLKLYVRFQQNFDENVKFENEATVIFVMVVSPLVFAHDVSARAGDVSMAIAVFSVGWIYSGPFEKLEDG